MKSSLLDDRVQINITDTGIGIPQELAENIFEPFFTVDKNRSRENGGVGLGLSIAKRYTEIQGGNLILSRTGPEGTSFILTFPSVKP